MEVTDLPAVNASLNGLSAILLTTGYVLIRQRKRTAHRNCMLAAFACSVLFLCSYLFYHAQVGSMPYQGVGALRTVYFTILITHTVLAALVPFIAVITLVRALRERFDKHVRLARITLPIWLYVSVTGVIIYWMLYRL